MNLKLQRAVAWSRVLHEYEFRYPNPTRKALNPTDLIRRHASIPILLGIGIGGIGGIDGIDGIGIDSIEVLEVLVLLVLGIDWYWYW